MNLSTFEFATATRILFGAGKRSETPSIARTLGHRALIVTGGNTSRADWLRKSLHAAGLSTQLFSVPGEPKTTDAITGAALARGTNSDLIIALGGGSAIDCA